MLKIARVLVAIGAVSALATASVLAADPLVYDQAPDTLAVSGYDWSGFYAGVHAGYGWATSQTDEIFAYDLEPEGGLGGVQAGVNHQFSGGIVVGLEADASLGDLNDDSLVLTQVGNFVIPTAAAASITATGTIRGRIGYAINRVLPYLTGGIGWARQEVDYSQDLGFGFFSNIEETETHIGWTAGAGVEAAISDHLTAKVEYLYSDFGTAEYVGTSSFGPFPANIGLEMQTVKIGLNYKP